jgi:hypothetical protein
MTDKYSQAYDRAVAACAWLRTCGDAMARASVGSPAGRARMARLTVRAMNRSYRAHDALVIPQYSPLPDVAVRQLPSRRARAGRGRVAR